MARVLRNLLSNAGTSSYDEWTTDGSAGPSDSSLLLKMPVHESGDLLIAIICLRATGAATFTVGASVTGTWVMHQSWSSAGQNPAMAVYYCKATGSNMELHVDSNGLFGRFGAEVIVVKDHDTTTPLLSVFGNTHGSPTGGVGTTSTISPASANALVFDSIGSSSGYLGYLTNGQAQLLSGGFHNGNIGGVITTTWHVHQPSTGTTSAQDIYCTHTSSIGCRRITFAVKDAGSGVISGQIAPGNAPATLIVPLVSAGTSPDGLVASSWTDRSALIATYNGEASAYLSPAGASGAFLDQNLYPAWTNFNFASSTYYDKLTAASIVLDTPLDLSDALIAILHHAPGAANAQNFAPGGGWYIGLVTNDATSDAVKLWRISAADTKVNPLGGIFPYLVEVNQPAVHEADDGLGGAFDITNVEEIVIGAWVDGSVSSQAFALLNKLETLIVVGGSSTEPAGWSTLERHCRLWMRTVSAHARQGSDSFYATQGIQIGNSNDWPVYWDTRNQFVEFASAYNEDDLQVHANMPEKTLPFIIKPYANDTMFLGSQIINLGNKHTFTFESGATGATITTDGGTMVGAGDPSIDDYGTFAWEGYTWLGCEEITYAVSMGDYTGGGNAWKETIGTQAISVSTQAELNLLAGTASRPNTFADNAIAITITGDHSTLTFPENTTFTGNTVDVRYEGTTNLTLTIPASVTGSLTEQQGSSGTITLENAATVTIQGGLQSGDVFWVWNATDGVLVDEGTATGTSEVISEPIDNGDVLSCVVARGGANTLARFEASATVTASAAVFNVALTTDSARVANDTTALGYAATYGITIGSGAITITGSPSIQQLYDYSRARSNESANLDEEVPFTTADGITLIQDAAYSLTVTGASASLLSETQEIDTAPTVASGAIYEDAAGVIWEDGGATYYAKHFWYNVKEAASPFANQQYAVIAVWDTDNDIDVVYTTGRVAGAIETDASGVAEGYIVYKVDSTTYTLSQQTLAYGFTALSFPVSSNGNQIGSPTADSVLRLAADTNVTLSRTAALAVSGITYTHSTSDLDFSDESLSAVQDHTKAKQFNVDDIESGKPGYESYYEEGILLSYDGSVYNLASTWTAENHTHATGTIKGGTVRLGTPGDIDINIDSLTIEYTADGTYDHRGEDNDGAITLTSDTQARVVTAQFDVGESITVDGGEASITLEQKEAWTLTAANLIDDTKYLINNDTKATELAIGTVSGGAGLSLNFDIGASEVISDGDEISCYFAYNITTTYKEPIKAEVIASAGSGGQALTSTQSAWSEIESWSIDGSGVTEFTLDTGNFDFDLSTAGTTTQKKRLAAWWAYQLTQNDGIRNFWDALSILSEAEIRQNVSTVDVLIHNTGATNVEFTDDDVRYYRSDNSLPYDPAGNSIFMDYSGVPFVVEIGSGVLTAGDIDNIWDESMETGATARQSMRLSNAAAGGIASGAATTNYKLRDLADSKDRVDATVDEDGNRSAVTLDLT